MPKIHKLSKEIISKIAAGEVIERPAYAVKELIENSLDADATKIVVSLKNFGLDEISVFDNGVGIDKEDLKIAIEPHATSKISSETDIESVATLGFRGEALSSIASISNFEIKSRVTNKKGYLYKNKKLRAVAMPEGTEVIIRNIFSSTPARKKFLKTSQTEYRQILSQFISFAIAKPEVEFSLLHNKKLVYKFKTKKLKSRISEVLGHETSKFLILTKLIDSYVRVDGFISHPQINFKSKERIFIYINGRRIHNLSLANAIRDGYKNLLMSHTYPLAILNIKIPVNLIDVNVHPRKEIIRLIDEHTVASLVKESVAKSLEDKNLTFRNLSFRDKLTKSSLAKSLREEISETKEAHLGLVKKTAEVIQLHNLYLVTETKNGVMIFDQHAVHEAVLYYKLKYAFLKKKEKNISLKIAKPILVKVSEIQESLVFENLEYLNKIGFDIEEFGEKTFKLSAVPLIATDLDPKVCFFETLESLENKSTKELDDNINSMLSYLACRSAIKSGQKLTKLQIKSLIKYLDKIDLGYTCPHGRPVKIELSKAYLETLFRR